MYDFDDVRGFSIRAMSKEIAIEKYKIMVFKTYTYETDYDGQEVKRFGKISAILSNEQKYKIPIKDQPLKDARPLRYSFIPESSEQYNSNNGTCAIDTIVGIYSQYLKSVTRESVIDLFRAFHFALYRGESENYVKWCADDGVTPSMIRLWCEKFDISVYGFDLMKQCFVKYVSKARNYPALVFYSSNGHMYLVNDAEKALSLVRSAIDVEHKINSKLFYEKENEQYEEMMILEDVPIKELVNVVKQEGIIIIYNKAYLNVELYEYIKMYNVVPDKIKTDNVAVQRFTVKIDNIEVVLMADSNVDVLGITHKEVKDICKQTNVTFKNQSFPALIKKLKDNHIKAKDKRAVSKEIKGQVFEQSPECAICLKELNSSKDCHVDHIVPLGSGGKDEIENLQVLCKVCHKAKTADEQDKGYIKGSETESTFNTKVQELFNESLAQSYAFVEHAQRFVPIDLSHHPIYKYDINKCRKNILYNGEYDFCLFTVMDDVKTFNPSTDKIKEGRYYIETSLYMPTRGNGWYYHNMVKYLLDEQLIKLTDIKYVIYSSLTVPKDYYNSFIDYIYNLLPEAQAKLAINSMIGQFKLKDREFWKLITITTDINSAYYYFLHYKGTYIKAVEQETRLILKYTPHSRPLI